MWRCREKGPMFAMSQLVVMGLLWVGCVPLIKASATPEVKILMEVKNSLQDPDGLLRNWRESDETPCGWNGVVCDTPLRSVTAIDLSNMNLYGPVPSLVCDLQNLSVYNVGNNYLGGGFPARLLECVRLEHLNLSQNLIVGQLPPGISRLQNLRTLDLCGNNFSGSIPLGFSDLPSLETLNLTNNLLNGTIPAHLGKLSNLKWLDLAYNPFSPGVIPPEFGNLVLLLNLHLAMANLVGQIPTSFGNLTQLTYFLDLSQNNLQGSIPQGVMQLPKLTKMELYNNNLSGHIPPDMTLLAVTDIDLSSNSLGGAIPQAMGRLQNLELLHLWNNELVGEVPAGLADLPKLNKLRLFGNNLTGGLPQGFGSHAPFTYFDVSKNSLSGAVPPNLCQGGRLEELILFKNSFWGGLPATYGNCSSLYRLLLNGNKLTGEVPVGLWKSPHLYILDLSDNDFHGGISPDIGLAVNLTSLILSNNWFNGSIPPETGQLPMLNKLLLSHNLFSGSIPHQLGNLSGLNVLSLSDNQLSGHIPLEISKCLKLSQLNLSRNSLTGPIPSALGSLDDLTDLDLSENQLSGGIPVALENLRFFWFNVSFNNLSGPVPQGLINGAFSTSFIGNSYLCARGLPLIEPCAPAAADISPREERRGTGALAWGVAGTFVAAALIFFFGSCLFFKRYKAYFKQKEREERSVWTLTSFHKLGFSEHEVLSCLDEDNLIGTGGAGKVYKATLSNGQEVAIKKLWTNAKGDKTHDYGFSAEVESLGKLRHKNIVKLLCCCSCQDCKLLVYEYMPNGSLRDQLHNPKVTGILDWPTRRKIAVGAAEGLEYLHHDYHPPVLHCDVKSNNILLDLDYEARVADFGLAKILQTCGKAVSLSSIAGTCGYIAPESAYTLKVNEKSDIYSFGVVLMELVTGKMPVEPEFGDGVDLVKWVCAKLQSKGGTEEVLDPRVGRSAHREMLLVLRVALLCTSTLPIQRPSMREVVQMLLEAHPREIEKPFQAKQLSGALQITSK